MLPIIGAFVGIVIDVVTPWSGIVTHQISAVLANPSVSGNPGLVLMLTFLGLFAAYLLPPIFGAAGGFFLGSAD
jgi:hypothetical protein